MGEAMDAGDEVMDKLTRLGEKVDSAVAKMQETRPEAPNNQHHQIITLHHAEPRKDPPWYVWASVGGGMVAVAAALLALQSATTTNRRMSDLRMDMQAERLSRELMDHWTAQEVTAIRSYITNGKLAPMTPRPMNTQPEKDRVP